MSNEVNKGINVLLTEVYNFDGCEWIDWYCYECDYGRKGMASWDENNNEIYYDDKSLWEYLESLRKK